MSKIAKGELGREELDRIKQKVIGDFVLKTEGSDFLAGLFGTQELLFERIHSLEEFIDFYEKVKLEDVVRVAQDIFKPESLNLALVGPHKKKQKFQKILEKF